MERRDNKGGGPKRRGDGPRDGKSASKKPSYSKRKPASSRDSDASEKKPAYKKPTYSKPRPKSDSVSGDKKPKDPNLIRLNKYVANAGVCSRRDADTYIASGNVTVNGEVINEMGYKVNKTDVVKFDGRLLMPEKKEYILLNKPKGFITTTSDDKGRRTVMELVMSASKNRLLPVGRLDRNTTGLLLFTNDGDLAKKLTHPKYEVRKIYHIELSKSVTAADIKAIREGLTLEDGPIKVDEVSYVENAPKRQIGIQIHSGRNRIVRRIFEHLGYEVVKLDRVVFAGLTKKDLPRGHWRFITKQELINIANIG